MASGEIGCSARSETYKGCRTETSCVKSKMYAEVINTYTNVIQVLATVF